MIRSSLYFPSHSCGSCGYELNLSSSNRNTSSIGSKYGKSIKRGKISFFNIDASKFIQVDELRCMPHFSKHSWGLFRRRTKLLCQKCGNHIGNAYDGHTSSLPLVSHATQSPAAIEASNLTKYDIRIEESIHTKYDIRIRSLQPSSYWRIWCMRFRLTYLVVTGNCILCIVPPETLK